MSTSNTKTIKVEHGSFHTVKTRYGFKSETQLPFFMLWEEFWYGGKVVHANCLYKQDGLEP